MIELNKDNSSTPRLTYKKTEGNVNAVEITNKEEQSWNHF